MMTRMRSGRVLTAARMLAGLSLAAGLSLGAQSGAGATSSTIGYSLATLPVYGGEPSITSDHTGRLYETTPSGGTITYTSTNSGQSWEQTTTANSQSGDDCIDTDQSNAVYLCNLILAQNGEALQADVYKSTDQGKKWKHGAGLIPQCGTSCSEFGVDRPWVDAWIPPGGTTNTAEVVLMYHDIYGPSQIWVNISHDGGATFGPAQEVLASPAVTPGAITGTLVAQGYSFCNTVPAGVQIVKSGTHAGRIIVAWIAADLPTNATGCNVTMTQPFHTLWISYSDNNGTTWTPQQAFDAGIGHDASTPFVGFTLDDQGNPYFGFANNLNANAATCSTESTAGTVQSDYSCEYNMYVVWSSDGGIAWDGGGGLIPGSAATPYSVNAPPPYTSNVPYQTGTSWFPTIAAGDPGNVDVAYLHTPEILPTDALGKADPGGCAGPGPANGNPSTYPPACQWNLFAAQSLNLTLAPGKATWALTPITTTPMHIGDICNLGIFCGPTSNRNLLDFIMETLDPQGCAHIAYADDNSVNKLRAANQISGPCIIAPHT